METKKFIDILEIYNGKNQKSVENPDGKYPIYGSGGEPMNISALLRQWLLEEKAVSITLFLSQSHFGMWILHLGLLPEKKSSFQSTFFTFAAISISRN